jgi:hypothetical protein
MLDLFWCVGGNCWFGTGNIYLLMYDWHGKEVGGGQWYGYRVCMKYDARRLHISSEFLGMGYALHSYPSPLRNDTVVTPQAVSTYITTDW